MKDKLEELWANPREGDSWAGEAVEEMEEARAARALVLVAQTPPHVRPVAR